MADLAARRWVLSGRVQGVGFRWYVSSRAQVMGIRGWVRNLPDGSVEAVGVATGATLDDFDRLLRDGPPGARIESVEIEDIPHETVDAKSFTIKR